MSSMVGLNTLIEDLTNTGAMWIFALALVLYEYCLTFADEIDQIWSQPRPVRIRLLFAICRYWPLLNIIADDIFLIGVPTKNTKACEIWFNWYSYATIPTRCAIASLQISKLHAMYQCDKKVLITLCFVCVIELLASTAIDGYLSYTLKSTALPPPLTGCMTGSHRSFAWVFWVPGLAFESILFLFALAKLVEEATAGIRTPHLMMVLLRDLIIYFGSVTSLILANLVIWIAARPSLFAIALSLHGFLLPILSCRMLLNLLKTATLEDDIDTSLAIHATEFQPTFARCDASYSEMCTESP